MALRGSSMAALGGMGGGRIADRSPRPLGWCAAITVLAGIGAAITPDIIAALPGAIVGVLSLGVPAAAAGPLLAAMVAVPPGLLLGATWPLWVRGLSGPGAAPRRLAAIAAAVHASQLLGAGLGLEYLLATVVLAGLIQVVMGALKLMLAMSAPLSAA